MVYFLLLKYKVKVFRQLSGYERRIFIQAMVLLPVLALFIQVLGFGKTRRILQIFDRRFVITDNNLEELERAVTTAHLVRIASQYNRAWTKCLSQSLAIWWLLRNQNIASELVIGTRREKNKLEAHAWINCQGIVLNDNPSVRQQFVPFNRPVISEYK